MNICNFIENNPRLMKATCGLAVLGYIGYRTVHLIKNKCLKIKKVQQSATSLSNTSSTSLSRHIPQTKNRKKPLIIAKDREKEARRLQKLYKERVTKYKPVQTCQSKYFRPAGEVNNIPGNFSLWMPGVAFIASHLMAKKNLKNLFVCETLEAFSTKLNEIANDVVDIRCAFIIGTDRNDGYKTNFPQHKVAVLVEMKAGQLTIALMDAQPIMQNQKIDPKRAQRRLWKGPFEPQELAFQAIIKACSGTSCTPRYLHSHVIRERHYGCEVYALQDAVTFLQDSEFFNRISCSSEPVQISDDEQIEVIDELPPEYLIGVQSSTFYEKLKRAKGQAYFDQALVGRKKTLQEYVNAYHFNGETNKLENHYITKKTFQYLNRVVEEMKNLNSKQFNKIILKTFLTEVSADLYPQVGYRSVYCL